jgi:hypothetical protein
MRRAALRLCGSLAVGVGVFTALIHPVFAASIRPGGAAAAGVSGYAVSDISYQLSTNAIDRLAAVSFQLDKPAKVVRAGVGSAWADCAVAGTTATCTFATEPRIEELSSLQVVATG